ncbi:MAG: hypothetical protein RL646_1884 [Verrucomicrobiota bacterium]
MRILTLLLVSSCLASAAPVPEASIAKKGELLFSDDFSGAKPDARWVRVVPTFSVEDGVLKGVQTRVKDEPTKDGKGVIKAHAAVHGLNVPTKDSVVEVKVRFDGATMIDVELDDRDYKGAHYGHICRAQLRLDPKTGKGTAVIIDEKEGNMRNDIRAMKDDPSKKAEMAKLLVGRSANFPAEVTPGKWHALVVEIVGDQIRVVLDGKPVGYLKSPGIAHATKSRFEFGVAGQGGAFDDLKVFAATPAN